MVLSINCDICNAVAPTYHTILKVDTDTINIKLIKTDMLPIRWKIDESNPEEPTIICRQCAQRN